IDESSGVDYHLEPGCHVDVVGVFTVRKDKRTETIARTILENIEVVAVGQRLAPETPTSDDKKSSGSSRRERPARAVTLLVKPAQVPTLHLAEQKGKIKLSMRGALDEGHGGKSATVVEDDLLGEREPEPAGPEPSWRDRLSSFASSLWQTAEPQPEPAPQPQPVAGQQPQLAWVMAVYNGGQRRLLGWTSLDDFQPIELSSEGPNIFQDEPQSPPPKPSSGSQSGGKPPVRQDGPRQAESKPQSEPESEPDVEPETEFEPEELFE
ncbi:unnamed protein product, partial [marine sediment metagenome]